MARIDSTGRRAGLRLVVLRIIRNFSIWAVVAVLIGAGGAMVWLDTTVRTKFGNLLWDLPIHVYSRPFELHPGLAVTSQQLTRRLDALGYRRTFQAAATGEYAVDDGALVLFSRPFDFWDGPQRSRPVRLTFSGLQVSQILDETSGASIQTLRLTPHLLGSLSNAQHEDRIVTKLEEMPKLLLAALVAVEDKSFDRHIGIDFRGILRSLWVNIRAGRIVQGGSTLSQQLIKNVYEMPERTYRRKLLEIVMALFLELRFEKHQILEMYCNEVFLGQDGNRAVHGFGLASHFYFGRPVTELSVDEIALLVGMIKAPSALNPRRNPEQALERRQVVLQAMLAEQLIGQTDYDKYRSAPLRIARPAAAPREGREFAAFLGEVSSKLDREVSSTLAARKRFSVYTTMDIVIQRAAESALREELAALESERSLPKDSLQGVAIVVRPDNGEVLAMAGGRKSIAGGFNRATLARRPIGSLIKPLVYLTGFELDSSRTLATLISDAPLTHRLDDGTDWSPKNYDGKNHGDVTILEALANSYNVAAARFGLSIGVSNVARRLKDFGALASVQAYPSMLLGSVELTPMQVAQAYQALANYGYRIDLQTISATSRDAGSLFRPAPTDAVQVASRDAVFLAVSAMKEAVASGTGAALSRQFAPGLQLAGKTGTTNNYRDSWFAGFAGNYLAVVWVGRDDNKTTGLTGSAGAMRIWGSVMKRLNLQTLKSGAQSPVETVQIDLKTGLRASPRCLEVRTVPFLEGTAPKRVSTC